MNYSKAQTQLIVAVINIIIVLNNHYGDIITGDIDTVNNVRL